MSQVNFSFLCFSNEHFFVHSFPFYYRVLLTWCMSLSPNIYHGGACVTVTSIQKSIMERVEETDPLVVTTNTCSVAILLCVVYGLDLCHEVDASALLTIALIVEEGRVANLGDSRSLLWVVGKEPDDQVFESWRQLNTIDSLEVSIIALLTNHFVVFVFEDLGAMGELALHDDEKKDTH